MNEMSGECWTELKFSILEPNGQRDYYQARWELHRAGGNSTGAVQAPIRKLNRIDKDGNIIEVMTDTAIRKELQRRIQTSASGYVVQ